MARLKRGKHPTYRLHRPSGKAVVTLNGEDYYLGEHGTQESIDAYDALILQWLGHGRRLPQPQADTIEITVVELVNRYRKWAEEYYRKNGESTGEAENVEAAVKPWVKLFGRTAVNSFGPNSLRVVQEYLIPTGLARTTINERINRIRRVVKWAVSRELVGGHVLHALQAVEPLKRGRSAAKESDKVTTVPNALVEAIRTHVSRQVWAMIELQLLTGMRPGEVVIMRCCDLDTTGDIWEYRPSEHKTQHHGKERIIPLGPRAQTVLKPFLKTDTSAYLFSPEDADRERRERATKSRKTPLSCGNRPGTNRQKSPRRRPRDRYDTTSYCQAIQRGCDAAFPLPPELAACRRKAHEEREKWERRTTPAQRLAMRSWFHEHRWHPNQLRHNRATELRKKYGIDAARAALGHSSTDVTEIYAERDLAFVVQMAREVG